MSRSDHSLTKDFHSKIDMYIMMTLEERESKYTYYQFQKPLGLPIFIRVDLSQFTDAMQTILTQMQFVVLEDKDRKSIPEYLLMKSARLLTISDVTPKVARQLYGSLETDRYGKESITQNNGHQVYRFKGQALMIYALYASEWKIALFEDFGKVGKEVEAYSIMNRFLSWALAPFGIIGFWGVPVDEGAVVLKQSLSKGEAFYIDMNNNLIISIDGNKKITRNFSLLKLSQILKGKNKTMRVEEFFSFLSNYCTYFDSKGHSLAVRQMILSIAKTHNGLIYPSESFRPRTDLVL